MYNNSVSLYPSLENPIQASICELSSSFFSPVLQKGLYSWLVEDGFKSQTNEIIIW